MMRTPVTLVLLWSTTLSSAQTDVRELERSSRIDAATLAHRAAQASRSDSIDILHTRIDLDLTQVGTGQIFGRATLRWAPKVPGIDHLPLDLLALTVDSVTLGASTLSFAQSGELLDIDLGATHGPGDTLELTVHYHGDPVIDGSGWGGFYTSGSVIYDLGVAFESQPHSFGRSWFPCFDNFVERCSFEFIVRTHNNRHAWCNGTLVSETDLGGGAWESHWVQDETMPSYLASVTASTYAVVRDTFPSVGGYDVPVTLVAQPGDTADMTASFLHLKEAFDSEEHWFGRYRWDRVGYCATPEGAMEHACNISYPTSIINGNLQYEATMAHELAHHWFGDLVTCERAEEMYINEGFAEYISHLFLEWVYGNERYKETVRDNHRAMVHRSHLTDEGWWALADMPQERTYGTTTYNKGADVIHTLRNYLGDSLFREGLTSFLDTYAFEPVNSIDLRDHLALVTDVALDDFFDDWIFQPGWASFEVDSFTVSGSAPDCQVTVHIEQKLRGPADLYHNVPVTLIAHDGAGVSHRDTLMLGGQQCSVTFTSPFAPVRVGLNEDERISLAITQDVDTLTGTGIINNAHADVRLTVNALPAPSIITLQEHWVAADDHTIEPFAHVISPDRWWRISGELPVGADISARFNFDGRATSPAVTDPGFALDAGSVPFHEDSVVLMYRPDAGHPWMPVADQTVSTQGNASDGYGRVDMNGFTTGDYALAWRKSATGLPDRPRVLHGTWSAHPNPASDRVTVEWSGPKSAPKGTIELLDTTGRTMLSIETNGRERLTLEVDHVPAGACLFRFVEADGDAWPMEPVMIRR